MQGEEGHPSAGAACAKAPRQWESVGPPGAGGGPNGKVTDGQVGSRDFQRLKARVVTALLCLLFF